MQSKVQKQAAASSRIHGDKSNLLIYLSNFHVVICRQCKFAIQPSALSSHLLRHQIYRSERRELLQALSTLSLKDPEEVPLPSQPIQAITSLPIHPGHICLTCGHACASQKRMSQHWSETHGEHHSQAVLARPAALQTFFRGNKLRYFEVSSDEVVGAPTEDTESTSTNESPFLIGPETPNVTNVESVFAHDSQISDQNSSGPTLDIASLRYLHQFMTDTGTSVARGNETQAFWTNDLIKDAFKHKYLMFGILAAAAFHLAIHSAEVGDREQQEEHYQAGMFYQGAGLGRFRAAAAQPNKANSSALIAYSRTLGIQRCAQTLLENMSQPDMMAETRLRDGPMASVVEFCLLLRGSMEMSLNLQAHLPRDSGFLLRGKALELKRPLTEDQLQTEGPLPFLHHAVLSHLERTALTRPGIQTLHDFIEDRDVAKLCATAVSLSSEDMISDGWIRVTLAHLDLSEAQVTLLHCALRSSLQPSKIAYEQALRDNLTPPFPSRSRFAYLSTESYDRLTAFAEMMLVRLPPEDANDLNTAMREFLAMCYCFGRASAEADERAHVGAIESWIYSLSKAFVNMLEDRRTVALLIFGYFCRLFNKAAEAYWFMRAQAARLLRIVRANLTPLGCEILDQC